MRRLPLQGILLFIVMAVVVLRWQPALTVGQDKEDAQANFATWLDRAFSSDDLEWLPKQNRLLLKGKVNDAPAVFKIDTGAFGTLLTLKSAKERSLRVIDFNRTFLAAGGSGKIYGSPVKRLQLGTSIDLGNQRLAVMDLPSLDGIDGLLGGDNLGSSKAIIDYHYMKLRVPKNELAESLEQIAIDAGMTAVKLERDGNYMYADLSIGEKSLRMLIDTGAQRTVIGAKTAARLQMDVRDTDDVVVGAGDREQAQRFQKTSIDRMLLGKASLLNFECYVMPVDFLESYSQKPIDGILGADALARSRSLLSYANAVLILRPEEVNMASKEPTRKP